MINRPIVDTTLDEIISYIAQHIDSWAEKQVIWDLNSLDFERITRSNLQNFINQSTGITKKRKGLKTAVIVQSDLAYGMMRMLSILADQRYHFLIEAFRNESEARVWLEKALPTQD